MADEALKSKLQQIDANDTQIGSNDERIGTNDREIKGQVTALLQYGMGVTGIQRDRLGDVVYDLADGYGGGGGGSIPEGFTKFAHGSFVVASKEGSKTWSHGLGAKPKVVLLVAVQDTDEVLPVGLFKSDTTLGIAMYIAGWSYMFGTRGTTTTTAANASPTITIRAPGSTEDNRIDASDTEIIYTASTTSWPRFAPSLTADMDKTELTPCRYLWAAWA